MSALRRSRKGIGLPAWLRGRLFRVAIPSLLVACAIAAAAWAGAFRFADDILLDLRFSASERAPTGNIVFVDIDPASLQAIGVWPWPRTIYASALTQTEGTGTFASLSKMALAEVVQTKGWDALLWAAM
jgi:CHASE2 domain-containing sensor protein